MKINTTEYEFSHGKKPRGYGLWVFEVTGTDGNGAYTNEIYSISGKMGDARKEAASRLLHDCGAVKEITEVKILP